MSNEQEQVVGIEEALAKAYVAYVNYAYTKIHDDFHDFDFVEAVCAGIEPQPESTQRKSDDDDFVFSPYSVSKSDLAHLHRLIKNADMKIAEDAVESRAGNIMSFKSFVQGVIWTCEHHGEVPEESCFELQ